VPTATTRATGVAFVDLLDADAHSRRFLAEGAHELAVWPLADLLVGAAPQAHPRLDVAHVPHRDAGDALRLAEPNRLARRLMQHVPLLPVEPGTHLGLALSQPAPPLRAPLTAAQLLLQDAMRSVASLLARAQVAA
jgi:hypothetical protein